MTGHHKTAAEVKSDKETNADSRRQRYFFYTMLQAHWSF